MRRVRSVHVVDGVTTQHQHLPGVHPLYAQCSQPVTVALEEVVVLVAGPHADDRWNGVVMNSSAVGTGKEGTSDEEIGDSTNRSASNRGTDTDWPITSAPSRTDQQIWRVHDRHLHG